MTDIVTVYPAPESRPWADRSVSTYLKSLGLPPYSIESLLAAARIHPAREGHVLAFGPEWIHIITRGVVKETTSHGTTRLWRKGMILGDVSRVMLRKAAIDPSAQGTGPRLTFLTVGATLSITARTFGALIEKDPVLALLLAKLTNDRSQTVEAVYSISKADPVVRVARLLDYLVVQRSRRDGVERVRWNRKGVHPVPAGAVVLSGPSQADIAEVLGLGRTTVEKSIATLRSEGILNALEPGTRSNRYYEIMDLSHLRSLARSDS
ncbi:Crp/Fnr family transcriptional regulator [Streptomyces sp. NPDC017520]|uniref:Crp/Fnr family transcriptional regulator n=1 Tax=Streptomyces sp. NPDC017520 TaxID=3364998 RepID=UPI0037AA05BC